MTVLTLVYPVAKHVRTSSSPIPIDEAARTCAREAFGTATSTGEVTKMAGHTNRYTASVSRQSPVSGNLRIPCGHVEFDLVS